MRGLVAGLVAAAPAPGLAADPPCMVECRELESKGSLAEGLDAKACAARTCHQEARLAYVRGRFDEALASLDFIEDERRGSPAYQMDRGLVLYALARYEEALEAFNKVVAVFPNGIQGGAQRAHTLSRLGRLDEAIAEFQRLQETPGIDSMYKDLRTGSYVVGNIGVLKLRQGKLAEGRAELERALEIDGKNQLASTYLQRVVPALETGELEPAGLTLLEMAFEELALGKVREAGVRLSNVVEGWPRYEPAYLILAEGFLNTQMYAECEQLLTEAQTHLPNSTDVRVQRIRCALLRHGTASEQAPPLIAELRQIAEAHPDHDEARRMLKALDVK